jgi:lactate racemase
LGIGMIYDVQFGRGKLPLDVPSERVVGTLAPNAVEAVADVKEAVKAAIVHPYASKSLPQLLDGKRTALIVTVDHTRPSPTEMLLPILELCEQNGVAPSVIIATGRHRQMTDEELRTHLGESILSRCRVMQHDPFDDGSMVTKGATERGTPITVNKAIFEHDVVIGTGIIEPSYLCGWSGGRKLLMPGLASREAIDNNHYYLTQPGAVIGKLHGNPVSDDAAEFADALPLHFIVYAVSGPNDEVVHVVAGDAVKAHERACGVCEDIYKLEKMEADIVITSAGGAPYDCDLVQGKKAIIPAIQAVKRNGVIIICAECPEGLGAEKTFIDWLLNKTPSEVARDVLDRDKFNLGAHGANILARPTVEKNAKVILVTCPDSARELKGSYITALTDLSEAWELANLLTGRDSSILFIEKARRLIFA